MKKFSSILAISFLFVFMVFPILSFSTTRSIIIPKKGGGSLRLYKTYRALVVGISNYDKWPELPNATGDAQEVAEKLRTLGFEVRLELNSTAREMKKILNEMVYDIGSEEDVAVLFYYAGHGETEIMADKTKMGYIIPKDCPLIKNDPKGFATHAISMRDIESASLRIRARHVLMLFDSCFSAPMFRLVMAVPEDISEKSALPVRQYITAGRENEVVPAKSMFKRFLLIGLDGDADLTGDSYITGSELGMYISDKVVIYTKNCQHPQYGKINNPELDRGDFIFTSLKVQQKEVPREEKGEDEMEPEKKALEEEVERLKTEMKELSLKIEKEQDTKALKRKEAEKHPAKLEKPESIEKEVAPAVLSKKDEKSPEETADIEKKPSSKGKWLAPVGGIVAIGALLATVGGGGGNGDGGGDPPSQVSVDGYWDLFHNSSENCPGVINLISDGSLKKNLSCPDSGLLIFHGNWIYSDKTLRITYTRVNERGTRTYQVYEGSVTASKGRFILSRKDSHLSYTEEIYR